MNRVVRFHEIGPPEVLRIERLAPEVPRDGEVLIRVQAIGLNNSEAQIRRGEYPVAKANFPTRLGRECSGVIVAVGAGVADWREGDEVSTIPAFDLKRHGVYGDWAVTPAHALARVPKRLSRLQAAAIWQQYLTAYGPLVDYGCLKPGDTVVVTAGSSSVGLGALQVARLLGLRTIATSRTSEKRDFLLAHGADHVIAMDGEDPAGRVAEITAGKGANLIFDPITGPGVLALVDALAPGGVYVCYGQLDPRPAELPFVALMRKGASVRGYTLWELTLNPAKREAAKAWIFEHVEIGALNPVVDRVFGLDEIVDAHRYLESGAQKGKIVIDVAGSGA